MPATNGAKVRINGTNRGKHDRFGPVSFVEGVCLLQMLSIEDATLRIAEKPLTDFIPDPIICGMPENSCDREQHKNE